MLFPERQSFMYLKQLNKSGTRKEETGGIFTIPHQKLRLLWYPALLFFRELYRFRHRDLFNDCDQGILATKSSAPQPYLILGPLVSVLFLD